MERKTNISVWQLRLFEGFDRDIMVMQRDEEEVFDDALHVFFDKEYYDAYVAAAVKYSGHRYAYHEDKLGEAVNQIFEEGIPGLALHISTNESAPKNILGDEKYIAAKDLLVLRDAAESYHFLYMTSIDRCVREDAIARLWTKSVFIIGRLPDARVKPKAGENPVYEIMTMRRKSDGGVASQEDYDYESLKVFLTAESAMRFNPDKKPVSKYKLAMLSQAVRGKLHVVIEPHRAYWLEYDPAKLDLKGHLDIPVFNDETVKERIREYMDMEKIYILLAPVHSDYRQSIGNPLLMKADEKNVMIFLFEKYDDAVNYVLQSPTVLPVFDGIFPIGVLEQDNKLHRLETVLAIAGKLGVTGVNLDFDTMKALGCRLEYLREVTGYHSEPEDLLSGEELSQVMREDDGKVQYRMPVVSFCDTTNEYLISDARKDELKSHMDNDFDNGMVYMAGCSLTEMMFMMQETVVRFDNAQKSDDSENKEKYVRMMNLITVFITEALCEKPYVYTLREENGDFTLKNNMVYLIITNRYEAGRKGKGRLMPVGIDNPQFMEKLCGAGRIAVLTDGPGTLCMMDTKFMADVAKQWKKAEPFREEMMIYMTQGCGLSYQEAGYYYRRLRAENSIFVEFTSAVRSGAYPEIGMLTIEGFTAEGLARAHGLNMLQAYDALLALKEDPSQADRLRGEASEEQADYTEDGTGKKGIFGRLFKK